LSDLIEEENNFNMNDYLNGNYDYWLWLKQATIGLPNSTMQQIVALRNLKVRV
jgi:hypothetical protein